MTGPVFRIKQFINNFVFSIWASAAGFNNKFCLTTLRFQILSQLFPQREESKYHSVLLWEMWNSCTSVYTKHLRLGTAKMKEEIETEEGETRRVNKEKHIGHQKNVPKA